LTGVARPAIMNRVSSGKSCTRTHSCVRRLCYHVRDRRQVHQAQVYEPAKRMREDVKWRREQVHDGRHFVVYI